MAEGKGIALVTGAGSSMGQAVARRLLDDGYSVAVVDGPGKGLAGLGASIVVEADVATPEGVGGAFDRVEAELGVPDVVVACLPEPSEPDWLDAPLDECLAAVDAPLDAAFLCFERYAPDVIASDKEEGQLLFVTSDLAHGEDPEHVLRATSAWGIHGLVRNAAQAVARKGVHVNAICASEGQRPEDVAALCAFLVGECGHVDAQALLVSDGRFCA